MASISEAGRRRRPRRPVAARWWVPLAAGAALFAGTAWGGVPIPGAGEGRLLSVTALVVLLAIAASDPRPRRGTAVVATLVVAAGWVLPPGPVRATTILLLLVAGLAVAAGRSAAGWSERGGRKPGTGAAIERPVLRATARLLPLAVGVQALLRPRRLLELRLDGPTFLDLAVLPSVAAVALAVLAVRLEAEARRRGGPGARAALLAGAVVLPLGPGFTPAITLTLVALAGGAVLGQAAGRRGPQALSHAGLLAAATAGVAPLLVSVATGAGARGLPATLAALALTGRRGAAVAAVAALGAAIFAGSPAGAIPGSLALLLLLLPAAVFPARGRGLELVAVALLAVAGGRLAAGGGLGAGGSGGSGIEPLLAPLAPALALGALVVPRLGVARRLQELGSGLLLVAAVVLGAYPWMRPVPVATVLRGLGLAPEGSAPMGAVGPVGVGALVPVLLVAAGVWAGDLLRGLGVRPRASAAAVALGTGLGIVALLLLSMPPGTPPLVERGGGVVLTVDEPLWEAAVPWPAGQVVIDSHLANSVGLAARQPVARVRLRSASGEAGWTLAAGIDTAEWAADRPDLRAAGVPAPPAWLHSVAPGGGFFATTYRTRLLAPETGTGPTPQGILTIELAPGLPPPLVLALDRVEVRP